MSINISRTFVFTDGTNYTATQIESEISNIIQIINNANGGLYSWDCVSWTVRVFTGTGSITASTETVLVVNKGTGAATAVTLPSSPLAGRIYIVKDGKGDANSHNITISAAAGNIDGSSTNVITTNFGVSRFVYNGTQWNVI